MEWRCEWCGKPHESDDPPCDECGHHKFEQAIERVPQGGAPQDPVWVCTECGRTHQKHSPPCSRCGSVDLEMRDQQFDDAELSGTSYLDVLEPRYAVGYALAALLGGYLLLGVAGVAPLPALGGEPVPPDAPGYDERVDGLSLAAVENATVVRINERRRGTDAGELSRDARLTDIATYHNKRWVDSVYGDADAPTTAELEDGFDVPCQEARVVPFPVATEITPDDDASAYADASALATVLLEGQIEPTDPLTNTADESVGIDVHVAADGRAFVTVVLC